MITERIQKIKQFMKQNKITYDELSSRSGIPISTLNYIFTGRTENPRMDTMRAIEKALGMNTDGLWTIEDYASGFRPAMQINITPDEGELLGLYRRIGQILGKPGQIAFKQMGETLLKMENK